MSRRHRNYRRGRRFRCDMMVGLGLVCLLTDKKVVMRKARYGRPFKRGTAPSHGPGS